MGERESYDVKSVEVFTKAVARLLIQWGSHKDDVKTNLLSLDTHLCDEISRLKYPSSQTDTNYTNQVAQEARYIQTTLCEQARNLVRSDN